MPRLDAVARQVARLDLALNTLLLHLAAKEILPPEDLRTILEQLRPENWNDGDHHPNPQRKGETP